MAEPRLVSDASEVEPSRIVHLLAYVKEPELSGFGFERLVQQFPQLQVHSAENYDQAAPHLADAEILVTIGNHLGADAQRIFAEAPRLKWVQSFGTGVDNILGHPGLNNQVAVTNVHGIHGPQLSEAAFTAMLNFSRHTSRTLENQKDARWEKIPSSLLFGKAVGILGVGAIANELAPRCKAFGMRVVGITSSARELPGFDAAFTTGQLQQALGDLDYLVVLSPHTRQTHHLVNREFFKALPKRAVLVNLARGGVVNEVDLLLALDQGAIAGAALDVFEQEPLPADSPFWRHPKVWVTPHSAGFHDSYPQQAYPVIAQNIEKYLQGGVSALNNLASINR